MPCGFLVLTRNGWFFHFQFCRKSAFDPNWSFEVESRDGLVQDQGGTNKNWKSFKKMGVSKNRGTYPQIMNFNRVFHYKPSILGVLPLFLETPIWSCWKANPLVLWLKSCMVAISIYRVEDHKICLRFTLPETNIAPKNGWLEYYFPIGKAYFQWQTISFREGIIPITPRKSAPTFFWCNNWDLHLW